MFAGTLKIGDTITQYRWTIESLSERNGMISATGCNSAGVRFALHVKPTREVMVWRESVSA